MIGNIFRSLSIHRFQTVYNGTGFSYKVNKLLENTRYKFRISSANEAGQGPVSHVYEFRTAYAHPPIVKGKIASNRASKKKMNKNVPFPSAPPRVTSITTDGCLVEWSPVKPFTAAPADTILYRVQMSKNRETESKVVSVVPSFHRSARLSLELTLPLSQSYTGSDLQWRVNGLEPRSEYTIKVAAVRVPGDAADVELVGAFSPPSVFNTLGGSAADGGPGGAGGPGGGDAAKPGGSTRGAGLVATAVSCVAKNVFFFFFFSFGNGGANGE